MIDKTPPWHKISAEQLKEYLDNPETIRKYLRYCLAVDVVEGGVDSQEEYDTGLEQIERIVACYDKTNTDNIKE